MGLYDRLNDTGDDASGRDGNGRDDAVGAPSPPLPPPPPGMRAHTSMGSSSVTTRQGERNRNAELRQRLHAHLLAELSTEAQDVDTSPQVLEERVIEELNKALRAEGIPMAAADRDALIRETLDDVLRLGPIQGLLEDDNITEVMVNGPDQVFVEVGGRLLETDVTFRDHAHVRQTIDRIVSRVGRRIDESSPYVDARLPDGSRVNAVVPPISIDSPTLTIRKFSDRALTVDKLIDLGAFTDDVRQFMTAVVEGRMNVLVSGGTGAGKTTTLNALSSFIPADERIITIEDAAELRLQQPHVIRMEYRPPNIEGEGEVSIRDLVRNALRMRPDRIIVGEVRGGEALDMLQAMNTGHDGSISTVHANSPRDVLARLETMVLMSGVDLPLRAVREQIASAIQLIVHQSRLADGSRRFTHVTEITGMEGDTITLQDIFLFDFRAGRDEDGRFVGDLRPTGLRPRLLERVNELGLDVPMSLFDDGRDLDATRGW